MRSACNRTDPSAGLSLIELVITMGLSSIFMLGIAALTLYSGKTDTTAAIFKEFNDVTSNVFLWIAPDAASGTRQACLNLFGGLAFNPAGTNITQLKVNNQTGGTALKVGQASYTTFQISKMTLSQVPGTNSVTVSVPQAAPLPNATWIKWLVNFHLEVTQNHKGSTLTQGTYSKDYYFPLYTSGGTIISCDDPINTTLVDVTCDQTTAAPNYTAGTNGGINFAQCIAQCPVGYNVVSGGCSTTTQWWHVVASNPNGPTAWICRTSEDAGAPASAGVFQGFAKCTR